MYSENILTYTVSGQSPLKLLINDPIHLVLANDFQVARFPTDTSLEATIEADECRALVQIWTISVPCQLLIMLFEELTGPRRTVEYSCVFNSFSSRAFYSCCAF